MGVVDLVQYCIDHELGRRGRSLYAAEFYRGGAAGVYLVLDRVPAVSQPGYAAPFVSYDCA